MTKKIHRRKNNPAASLLSQMKPLGMTLEGGTVLANNGDGTIDMDYDGATVPDIRVIGGTPTVGDQIWALRTGSTLLALAPGGGEPLYMPASASGSYPSGVWGVDRVAFPQGSVGHIGSHRLGIHWNWERGAGSEYDGLGVNSYTSAYGFEMGNDGFQWVGSSPYGETGPPDVMARLYLAGASPHFEVRGSAYPGFIIANTSGQRQFTLEQNNGEQEVIFILYNSTGAGAQSLMHLHHSTDSNAYGISKSSVVVDGILFINSSEDASLTEADGALIIGTPGGAQLRLDNNEILSVVGTTPDNLYLQIEGGNVYIGENAANGQDIFLRGDVYAQQGAGIYINDTNTRIDEGTSNSIRLQTNNGYVDVGPQNTGGAHIYTDRAQFYFNKPLLSVTGHDLGSSTYYFGDLHVDNHARDATATGWARYSNASPGSVRLETTGSTYRIYQHTSSERFKTDLEVITAQEAWAAISAVSAVTYQGIAPPPLNGQEQMTLPRSYGFSAEEMHQASRRQDTARGELAALDADGLPDSIGPEGPMAVMWAAMKDVQDRLLALEGATP